MLHTLYVDMNSFFASVEQQLHPELRGKPVAVVPMVVDTTSVIAASYEAKKYGVKTGVLVGEARRMCPGLICVTGAHDEYIRFHHKVLAAIDTVIPVDRVCSVDEVACRLLREQREPAEAERVAKKIKKAIAKHCGECLTSSIGIAPNRILAKIAADMHKPDGLTIVQKHELPRRLFKLSLMDLPGIGPKMHQRLRTAGISTVERLCSLTEEELRRAWGSVIGGEWYYRLRGEQMAEPPTVRRSIGHSHVLSPQRRTDEGARAVAVRLLTKLGQRARALGYVADQMMLSIRYLAPRNAPEVPGAPSKWHASAHLASANDTTTLMRALAELWEHKPRASSGPILKLGVTLFDLTPHAWATPPLFEDRRNPVRLSKAMDAVNKKYGADSLYPASMHDAKKSAPRRIAFGNIPDLEIPDLDEV